MVGVGSWISAGCGPTSGAEWEGTRTCADRQNLLSITGTAV